MKFIKYIKLKYNRKLKNLTIIIKYINSNINSVRKQHGEDCRYFVRF